MLPLPTFLGDALIVWQNRVDCVCVCGAMGGDVVNPSPSSRSKSGDKTNAQL